MAMHIFLVSFFSIFFLCSSCLGFAETKNRTVPALFIFGDSLVDVGNNNYIPFSLAKANYPHNGIDFPTRKPTGRFSNGKNAADFLAEKMGLPTLPPYLSPRTRRNASALLMGVNFASGGAGIFTTTNLNNILGQSISLSMQVDFYLYLHEDFVRLEPFAAQNHLLKSVFAVVIGSNDLFDYFRSQYLRWKNSPQQYVDLMVIKLKGQLKRLYNHGARKFLITGLPEIGCIPAQRMKNPTEECNEEANHWSVKYNEALQTMLDELHSELHGMSYSCFDSYKAMHDVVKNPAAYGFMEIKAACCGLGELNANFPCVPISWYCTNRREYMFWDMYHPTEEASRVFVDILFDGSSDYTFPMNLRQLIAI